MKPFKPSKQIIVHYEQERCQLALLEDGKLVEFYVERPLERERAGNIYKGRVVNVLPGMEAAFVDIGLEKNAFLHMEDLLPAHLEKRSLVKTAISGLVRTGQHIMVQVKKEPYGSKGARITTHFTIPGRWIVLLPNADYVAVSKKIDDEEERIRLRSICEGLRLPEEGLIIRTVSQGESLAALENDLLQLRELWSDICLKEAQASTIPALLYRDLEMIPRLIRDIFTEEIAEIIVDNEQLAQEISWILNEISPQYTARVKLYKAAEAIFTVYPVAAELEKASRRKIELSNGGYLVLDRTEALIVIDVNTGKYVGDDDLEKTVFSTNMEAAREIAKLLRLLDLSGIIIIDFIDMLKDEHRRMVAEELERICANDRTKTNIVGWTKLGLMEVTRKKVRYNGEQRTNQV
jgi:ribonuclease G